MTISPWNTVTNRLRRGGEAPIESSPAARDYQTALPEISAAKPLSAFRVSRPLDVVRDGLGLALVRPKQSNPLEIEVIDFVIVDGPAFQKAVARLVKLWRSYDHLAHGDSK